MELIYVRMRNRVHVKLNQEVKVKDVVKVIGPEDIVRKLEDITLLKVKKEDKNIIIIDLVQIIQEIGGMDAELEVQTFGPAQTIVEVVYEKRKFSFLFFIGVWMLLFIGTGITIMNYHVDVSMQEVHQKLFKLITGREDKSPLLIQIPYSIGLGLGMVLFFNHFFKKRFNEEPSPLEVEMFNYQQDLDQYVIMNENKESIRQIDDR
ncbi:stage V sporulation protein AA [Peribacillus loiseleuriae]|uniref:Stage V sporulation protein AA n=1 Tax=Peribacillus loiseleuriae TaxID=1679170 RepID=A0A0K9GVK0_9BACI|nr:stage V sporulation protein AA [Peribacillus loiseleuriae]KMY50656.1 stage V sporulation protein AA [Peribacillus loiseleuriae]